MPEPTHISEEQDEKLGTVHENLQGWVPSMATDEEIRTAFEKAFDYRGDLTITLKDGQMMEGYVFDRRADGSNLDECILRIIPKDRPGKISIRYSDIAGLAFTGKDTAAGKSFEAWVRKYNEKKARGEKNIGIEAEPLE
ncbi:MAG TPA: hypothetical protein VFI95_05210 [Terriglobales bacterium]|nr:hypothetical protein [Terriglobales bacterium]